MTTSAKNSTQFYHNNSVLNFCCPEATPAPNGLKLLFMPS